jgi:hypothetical protein
MTGAAIIPGGVDGGRPGTPSGGMFRYNTTLSPDSMEFYDAGQSAWVALATLPQLQGVALDAYSNFSGDNGGGVFTDTPVFPATTVRNTITVPAGYNNFIIYSAVAFRFAYDTTTGATGAFNSIYMDSSPLVPPAPTFPGPYLAVLASPLSNNRDTQLGSTVFYYTTASSSTSHTFTQVVYKTDPFGPVIPQDSTITVFAWTI